MFDGIMRFYERKLNCLNKRSYLLPETVSLIEEWFQYGQIDDNIECERFEQHFEQKSALLIEGCDSSTQKSE